MLGIDPDPAQAVARRGRGHERGAGAARDHASEAEDAAGGVRESASAPSSAGVVARLETAAAVLAHCLALIDAAAPACVAAKPQLACFERLGAPGWLALEHVCAHARERGLLVLADGKRGDVPVTAAGLRAGAGVAARRRRSAPSTACGADAFTANPLLGRDALEPLIDAARAHGSRRVRARAHVQPGRRRPARPRARDRRAAVGAAGGARRRPRPAPAARASPTSAPSPARPSPQHLARLRELMPQHALPAPGHRRPGRRRRRARPGVRPRPRRRARHRLALDRQRPRVRPRRAARGRPRRGRAAARAGMGAELTALALYLRRDGRSQPRALPRAHRAGRRSPSRSTRSSRTRASPAGGDSGSPASATATPTATKQAQRRSPRSSKRKTYTVKSGDTPSGIAEKTGISLETLHGAQPRSRPADPRPGPEDQAEPSEAHRRRAPR